MANRWQVKMEGRMAFERILAANVGLQEAWHEFLREAGKTVVHRGRGLAPVGAVHGGSTRDSIRAELKYGMKSTMTTVTADAVSKSSGERYPFILEAGHRAVHSEGGKRKHNQKGMTLKKARAAGHVILHYRGQRKSTRRWFSKALTQSKPQIFNLFDQIIGKIQARWRQ